MTDLYLSVNETSSVMRLGTSIMKRVLMDVHGGAKNELWAATASKEEVRSTHYWKPVGIKSGGSFWHAQKSKLAEELWEWTEKEFDKHGY